MGVVAMRTDCKHYESRTYASGEVVRKCRLDLAPEAPWRCPADCAAFERRLVDAGWQYGSLSPAVQEPPAPLPDASGDVAALLDEAEAIVNAAGRELKAEQAERSASRRFKRKKKRR
jgi:hypothetical protein